MAKPAADRYSQPLKAVHPSNVPPLIREAVFELGSIFRVSPEFFEFKHLIAVKLELPINLPNRGTVGGIDIQEVEPILICFDPQRYPYQAPQIRLDRIKFPRHLLPHLNPVPDDEPAWICLMRGSIHDWFADHTLLDLIRRAQEWLQDAASKNLIKLREGDRFEETRIDSEQFLGISVFDYAAYCNYINEAWQANSGPGTAYTASRFDVSDNPTRLPSLFTTKLSRSLPEIQQATNQAGDPLYQPGLLLWPAQDKITTEYIGSLPYSTRGLCWLANYWGIDLIGRLASIEKENPVLLQSPLPIFLCIHRPAQLLQHDADLEILTFVRFPEPFVGKEVYVFAHRSPLTPEMARSLSVQKAALHPVLLVGCGALGSKISTHLGRSGVVDITLVDPAALSPHNLVRHALFANHVGEYKVEALKKEIQSLFDESHSPVQLTARPASIFDLFSDNQARETLHNHPFIVDTTASTSVLKMLADKPLAQAQRVIRGEIADDGNLGILIIEGPGRSPKLDDLEAALYDLAVDNPRIEKWLRSFSEKVIEDEDRAGLEDVTVGLGCSSPTMRLADDVVAYHASAQSIAIRQVISTDDHPAGILLNAIESMLPLAGSTKFIPVGKYKSLPVQQAGGWRIRIHEPLIAILQEKMAQASPNETGGILIGRVNARRKIIHVTRLLDPPPDSEASPYSYKMGICDIPDQIVQISEKSGRLISYVGEWHSHPNGGGGMSSQDMEAMRQLKKQLDKLGMPTVIMVVAPAGCFPHLFPPK